MFEEFTRGENLQTTTAVLEKDDSTLFSIFKPIYVNNPPSCGIVYTNSIGFSDRVFKLMDLHGRPSHVVYLYEDKTYNIT